MKIELIDQVKVQNELGEGVIWDHRAQRIWWTDIQQSKLFQYDPVKQKLQSWSTPERLSCFTPVFNDDRLLCAFASGFAFYHPQQQRIEWIKKIEPDNPGTRMNDGRTDRQGRFWAGSMVENAKLASDNGKLYCLDNDLSIGSWIDGLSITNSLCWSPDSKTLYHADTPNLRIDQYDFKPETGEVGKRSTFTQTEPGCYPDGSIVDAQGYLWNAQWAGSKVVRYAPDGEVDFVLNVPVTQPTCVAFAGQKLDLLVVTSAWQDLDQSARAADPHAGDLLIYKTDCYGLAESPFKPSA